MRKKERIKWPTHNSKASALSSFYIDILGLISLFHGASALPALGKLVKLSLSCFCFIRPFRVAPFACGTTNPTSSSSRESMNESKTKQNETRIAAVYKRKCRVYIPCKHTHTQTHTPCLPGCLLV